MSQYNVLQAVYMAFYSKNLYRDVAINWGAKTFLYLLMLVALVWIFPTYQIQFTLNHAYARDSDKIAAQIPLLTIKDGKVITPENRPYMIVDPDSQETIAIIDTTGRYTTLDGEKANVLITETEIISQSQPGKTRIDKFPSQSNLIIDPHKVNEYIKYYLGFAWIIFYLGIVICVYAYRLIQALLYAVLGLLFKTICSVPLSYSQVLQIAMVAVTPAIIVAAIFDFFGIQYAYQMFSYFILSMIYLFYGIKANKV